MKSTRDILAGTHPDLIRKVEAMAADLKGHGHTIVAIEGVRSRARQLFLWRKGRVPIWNPKKQVTWTLNSKHFIHKDGFGHAADLAFVVNGRLSFDQRLPWQLVRKSAEAHGLISGASYGDLGHVELP